MNIAGEARVRTLDKVILFFILLGIWGIFLPVIDDYFTADDFYYLKKQRISEIGINFLEGREGLFYRPVGELAFTCMFRIFGFRPQAYHCLSLIIHCLNVSMAFVIMKRMLKDSGYAAFGCVIFAFHPLQAYIIPWASNLFELFSAFFQLCALNLFLLFFYRNKARFILSAYIVFVAALLCKGTATSLPLLILILAAFFRRKSTTIKKAIIPLIPFFMILAAYLLYRIFVLGSVGVYGNKVHFSFGINLWEHLKTYAGALFSPFLSKNGIKLSSMQLALLFLFFAAFNRKTRTGIFWFTAALSPALSIYGERFLYMPLIGAAVAAAGFFSGLKKINAHTARTLFTTAFLLFGFFSLLIIRSLLPYWHYAGSFIDQIPQKIEQCTGKITPDTHIFIQNLPSSFGPAHVVKSGASLYYKMKYEFQPYDIRAYTFSEIQMRNIPPPPPYHSYRFLTWTGSRFKEEKRLKRLYDFRSTILQIVPPSFYRKEWKFDSSMPVHNWFTSPELELTGTSPYWSLISYGSDPHLLTLHIQWPIGLIHSFKIEMAVSGIHDLSKAQIYWITQFDPTWDENKKIEFDIFQDSEFHIYSVDAAPIQSSSPETHLTGIRLDPAASPSKISLRSLTLIPPENPKLYISPIKFE